MTPTPKRADTLPPADDAADTNNLLSNSVDFVEPSFDQDQWLERTAEERGSGGRQVLAGALAVLAALWLAYAGWLAGRTLGGQPLTSPLIAQWLAVAAGPLALMGLAWLIFGRTRRKEAERFTRSVITMRSEARSLEALLEVLSQRITDSRAELTAVAQQLMQLGDETTEKLGGITKEFDSSCEKLVRHGEALDRAADAARVDMGVLLTDLPEAEKQARAVADQLKLIGRDSAEKAAAFGQQVTELGERARSADQIVAEATAQLAERLAEIETASAKASTSIGQAEQAYSGTLHALLDRTATSLEQIRSGIDVQAAAVASLTPRLRRAREGGSGRCQSLAANLDHATTSLESLSGWVAEQDRASQSMIAEIERGLSLIDQRFTELAANATNAPTASSKFPDSVPGSLTRLPPRRARRTARSLACRTHGSAALDAVAKRRRPLRKRADRAVLRARLGGKRVELGPGASERFEEAVGAFVAIGGKLGEALVDQRQTAFDLGDHLLRCAILLGDPARQAFERAVGMVDVGGERFGSDGAGLSDPRRSLGDQRRNRSRLHVDPRADLLERSEVRSSNARAFPE